MRRVLLKFRSPQLTQEIHSDTLFGALCWGYRCLFGENALESLLDAFKNGRSPFLISSCFPYFEIKDERVYLYPKPLALEQGRDVKANAKLMKKIKKMRYVSERLFREICSSPKIQNIKSCRLHQRDAISFETDGEEYVIDDSVAVEREVANKLIVEREKKLDIRTLRILGKYEKPGVMVNRLTISPGETLHFRSEYHIAPDAGLYFFIDGGSKVLSEMEAVLRFLADRGIGGKISYGRSAFEFKGMEVANLEKPKDAFVTLSLYLPTPRELEAFTENNTLYELIVRKGMVESSFAKLKNQWKDRLLMFAEGSIFPASGSEPYGRCEVVKREPFEVIHCGLAFAVNFRRMGDG